MKILMVNKFLYPNGGSETYIFKLGDYLKSQGHEVEYFGMEHEGRCVGNSVNAYTSDMDFHGGSKLAKLTYPLKTIYSAEARKKIRLVLDSFKPDVVHLNNFNYQLTPSIICEIEAYRKQTKRRIKTVFTAHDSQLVCPNHLMQNYFSKKPCQKCLRGSVFNCVKNRCIHGSSAKSLIGAAESVFWNIKKVYRGIDTIIAPSHFMAEVLSQNPSLKGRIKVMHNFVDAPIIKKTRKKNYVLYYGRYSGEKGIDTLVSVCKALKNIPFVFAGDGPLRDKVESVTNITNVGFKSGEELQTIIAQAAFTVAASECFENCPFTVMESQMYGTPVLGADMGGIPELIREGNTGELFESGNAAQLKQKIENMYNDKKKLDAYTKNCAAVSFDSVAQYCEKLLRIYEK